MRILLVEDDMPLAQFISKGLKEHGFAVDHAVNGEDGLHMGLCEPYDVAIIDIMLPKKDGFTLIEELRVEENSMPVLILSAKRTVEEKVRGFNSGSDDYLTKPFAFVELLARVQALIRRNKGPIMGAKKLEVGDLVLEFLSREVRRAGQKIELQQRNSPFWSILCSIQGKLLPGLC